MSRKPQTCHPTHVSHFWPMGHPSWPTKSCCKHASEDTRCWHRGSSFLGGWHLFTRRWLETNVPVRNHFALQGALVHVLNFCSVRRLGVENWLDPHLGPSDLNLPLHLQPLATSHCLWLDHVCRCRRLHQYLQQAKDCCKRQLTYPWVRWMLSVMSTSSRPAHRDMTRSPFHLLWQPAK